MSSAIQEEIIEGREPTAEERELVDWAQESIRKSLSTVHDTLRLMVTLTTALLAGSAAMLGQVVVAPACKEIGVALLFVSLAFALWGIYPREANVDVCCPDEIKVVRGQSMRVRMRCLLVSNVCLMLAFGIIFGGMLAHW